MNHIPRMELGFVRTELRASESTSCCAHERIWSDREITDDTLIVQEWFRVVERP